MTDLSHYKLPDGNVQIAFSSGRSSAYMLTKICEANGGIPADRCKVVMNNTGLEMNESLDFAQECGERFGVHITMLEYRRVDDQHTFEVVSHNSASRNGEPFDALLASRQMLPNRRMRYCSSELKTRTAVRPQDVHPRSSARNSAKSSPGGSCANSLSVKGIGFSASSPTCAKWTMGSA